VSRRPATDAGYTLVELMFVAGLIVVLAGVAVPPLLAGLDRSRTHAAARFLAARMALARAAAVTRSATVALRFAGEPPAVSIATVVDGNRNGIRTADIASGVDRPIAEPFTVEQLFPGVVIELAQVGAAGILSFTPVGTATSGTVYIRGRQGARFGVRVLGATGRARVLRYDARRADYVDTY
jgi:type II secretory pathway pseudopilin PulG